MPSAADMISTFRVKSTYFTYSHEAICIRTKLLNIRWARISMKDWHYKKSMFSWSNNVRLPSVCQQYLRVSEFKWLPCWHTSLWPLFDRWNKNCSLNAFCIYRSRQNILPDKKRQCLYSSRFIEISADEVLRGSRFSAIFFFFGEITFLWLPVCFPAQSIPFEKRSTQKQRNLLPNLLERGQL